MHELSIAAAILAIVERTAGERRVERVDVRIGHLRQVVPCALEFAFELVTAGTVAEGARLELEAVPAAVRCETCRTESGQDGFPLACAACGGLDVTVVRGEELCVDSLVLSELAGTAERTG